MKVTGAKVSEGSQIHRFERWLKDHASQPQLLTGREMNELMQTTVLCWGYIQDPLGTHYIEHNLFRVSREGIFIIKELQ